MNNTSKMFLGFACLCIVVAIAYAFIGVGTSDMTMRALIFVVLAYLSEILEEVRK